MGNRRKPNEDAISRTRARKRRRYTITTMVAGMSEIQPTRHHGRLPKRQQRVSQHWRLFQVISYHGKLGRANHRATTSSTTAVKRRERTIPDKAGNLSTTSVFKYGKICLRQALDNIMETFVVRTFFVMLVDETHHELFVRDGAFSVRLVRFRFIRFSLNRQKNANRTYVLINGGFLSMIHRLSLPLKTLNYIVNY